MKNKFRKKPIVVEAVQYTEAVRDAYLFDEPARRALPPGMIIPGAHHVGVSDRKAHSAHAYVDTVIGRMDVSLNDWIITDEKGDHYPCKPDIFAATYEIAEPLKKELSGPLRMPSEAEIREIARHNWDGHHCPVSAGVFARAILAAAGQPDPMVSLGQTLSPETVVEKMEYLLPTVPAQYLAHVDDDSPESLLERFILTFGHMRDALVINAKDASVARILEQAEHWAHLARIDHTDAADIARDRLCESVHAYGLRLQTQNVSATGNGLPVEQEPKYTVNGSAIVNRATGEPIPADEPVFILRAQDKQAAGLLGDYLSSAADAEHATAIEARFIQFSQWADAHPDRMKEPDTALSFGNGQTAANSRQLTDEHQEALKNMEQCVREGNAMVCAAQHLTEHVPFPEPATTLQQDRDRAWGLNVQDPDGYFTKAQMVAYGDARALAAFERGEQHTKARVEDLEIILGAERSEHAKELRSLRSDSTEQRSTPAASTQVHDAARKAIDEMDNVVRLGRAYQRRGEYPGEIDINGVREWRMALSGLLAVTTAPTGEVIDQPLHIGACLTEGKLHVTVMRCEPDGHITFVAQAEMDEASLRQHDCRVLMRAPDALEAKLSGAVPLPDAHCWDAETSRQCYTEAQMLAYGDARAAKAVPVGGMQCTAGITDAEIAAVADPLFDYQRIGDKLEPMDRTAFREIVGSALAAATQARPAVSQVVEPVALDNAEIYKIWVESNTAWHQLIGPKPNRNNHFARALEGEIHRRLRALRTPNPFGWFCELVHIESGEVVNSNFYRNSPITGKAEQAGYEWQATSVYTLPVLRAPVADDVVRDAARYRLVRLQPRITMEEHESIFLSPEEIDAVLDAGLVFSAEPCPLTTVATGAKVSK